MRSTTLATFLAAALASGGAAAQDDTWREPAKQTPIWADLTKNHPDLRDVVVHPPFPKPPLTLGLLLACTEAELMNLEAYGDITSYSLDFNTPLFGFGEPKIVVRLKTPKKTPVAELSLARKGSEFEVYKVVDTDKTFEKPADIQREIAILTAYCTSMEQFNRQGKLYKEPKELLELRKKGKVYIDHIGGRTADRD